MTGTVTDSSGAAVPGASESNPTVNKGVFEITRAYKIFQICDTVEEALQACR